VSVRKHTPLLLTPIFIPQTGTLILSFHPREEESTGYLSATAKERQRKRNRKKIGRKRERKRRKRINKS
jgi:hypothetical protein